ncbi:fibroblast growth factor 21 [Osmerus mordax]|uniref:fibroblast growth factor 21 n=1 Tax=Osmerus mordax TaxID=8014 RepID=UPI0035102DDD
MSLRVQFSLFSLALLLPLSSSLYIPDSNPLLSLGDQVRERHLYTENHRRGLFLEMTLDGRVMGNPAQTAHSVLELRAVRQGQVVIRGVSSSLYLCIDGEGRLRGQKEHTDEDCTFTEQWLGDGYNRFRSSHHGHFVSLSSKRPLEQYPPFSRFLPLENTLVPGSEQLSVSALNQEQFNLDSHDPFTMSREHILSPNFSKDRR